MQSHSMASPDKASSSEKILKSQPIQKKDEIRTSTINDQKGEIVVSDSIVPLRQALILRNEEKMEMLFQSISSEVSEQLYQGVEEGIQILSGRILEDYRIFDEFLLLFQANSINGLNGQFILGLHVQSIDPTAPASLIIRKAHMAKSGNQFSVKVDMKADAVINERWAYTRHPVVRKNYIALFDDPGSVQEGEIFHQNVFPVQGLKGVHVNSGNDWTTVDFVLESYIIEQSKAIDLCEILLDALDNEFSDSEGQYLQWTKSSLSIDTIETVASETENRLLKKGERISFNVIVEYDNQEISRKKRIKPLIQHMFTVVQKDSSKRSGKIGISISP